MSTNKRVSTKTTNIVDQHTGEVLHTDQVHVDILVKDEKEFFFVFSQHMSQIMNMEGALVKVLLWCSSNMQLNQNTVVLTKTQKEAIQRMTNPNDDKSLSGGLSLGSINNAVSALVKRGIFIKQGRSTYQIHPEFVWKGNMVNRNKLIQVVHTYKLTPKEDGPKTH